MSEEVLCTNRIYNNNRNRVFYINTLKDGRLKILTYFKEKNGCTKLFNVAYFNKGDRIDFNGNAPKIATPERGWNNAPGLYNSIKVWNEWKLYNKLKRNTVTQTYLPPKYQSEYYLATYGKLQN